MRKCLKVSSKTIWEKLKQSLVWLCGGHRVDEMRFILGMISI